MPDPIPFSPPAITRSHSSWAVEIGPVRFAMTRTRETSAVGLARSAAPARAWPLVIGTFAGVGALGLAVMGASAATRPELPAPYMISMAVPPTAAPHLVRRPHARPSLGHHARAAMLLAGAADGFAPADAPYVDRAMRTGAFQEWDGADGQHRFLTAGPARAASGRTCRDLAMLVRLADGGSHVHATERCVTGPVSDVSPDDVADDGGVAAH